MKALYLLEKGKLSIDEYSEESILGTDDVKIRIEKVGICGSDIHYYKNGRIGQYIVNQPMILGHEASGTVIEVGKNVSNLAVGDRVCMEPGIPDFKSRSTLIGAYNLDPALTFWATPPVHGCLRETVIHPASLTFKLPDHMSFEEGAMVEPLAIGMQASVKAEIKPGDIALVTGAGTIGLMSALSLLAGGCSQVVITDISEKKLKIAGAFEGLIPVNSNEKNLSEIKNEFTDNWGFDVVVEASGSKSLYPSVIRVCAPLGRFVMVGIPSEAVPIDVSDAQVREVEIRAVNRYCNVYNRAINLIASGKIDVKKMIGKTFSLDEAIQAYEYVSSGGEGEVKVMISLS